MMAFSDASAAKRKAVIYCRVSTKKQLNGSGLDSQEHRCRQYAAAKGYQIEAVFHDSASGGGDFIKRAGMVALLDYLDTHSDERFVVVFDDLKRYSRDVLFHLKLRLEMEARGATRECLNFDFADTPEGNFNEVISVAAGEFERRTMARQNRQKSVARLEQGFAVQAQPPVGLKYVKGRSGGKELVHDQHAPVVAEALEGYATGRFASQSEVKRFLENQPDFPKGKSGVIPQEKIVRMLRQPLYAGLVESVGYGVSLRKGRHQGLISIETYERNRAKLDGRVYAPTRKDIGEDFVMRGAVACGSCSAPLTAGWSKSSTGARHAYYRCKKRGCDAFGKSIRRDDLEEDFAALLDRIQPTEGLIDL
ncbi:MAG: recombinase family protein, partial [Pseudomonadota bacterium]